MPTKVPLVLETWRYISSSPADSLKTSLPKHFQANIRLNVSVADATATKRRANVYSKMETGFTDNRVFLYTVFAALTSVG